MPISILNLDTRTHEYKTHNNRVTLKNENNILFTLPNFCLSYLHIYFHSCKYDYIVFLYITRYKYLVDFIS